MPKNFVYADTLTCPIAELAPSGSAFANFVFTDLGVIVRKDAFYDANEISNSNAVGYIESGKLTLLKSLTVNGVNISATGTIALGGTLSATVGNFGSLYASTLFQVGKSGETKSAVIYGTLTVSSTINGVDLGVTSVSSGSASLEYTAAGTSVIGTFSVPAGKILEVIVRHDVTWSGGKGASENSLTLMDTDNVGDRVEWYISGSIGLKDTETLIVQNTSSSVKTYTLSEYAGMDNVTTLKDYVTYRYVIRSL